MSVRPSFRLSDGHGYYIMIDVACRWCMYVPGPGINYEYDRLGTLNKYQASEVSLTCWQQLSVDLHTQSLTQWHWLSDWDWVSDSLRLSTATATGTGSGTAALPAVLEMSKYVMYTSNPSCSFQLRSFDSYGLPACSMLSLYFDHGSAAWRT